MGEENDVQEGEVTLPRSYSRGGTALDSSPLHCWFYATFITELPNSLFSKGREQFLCGVALGLCVKFNGSAVSLASLYSNKNS